MPFSLDPQIASALAALFAQAGDAPPPVAEDVATRRQKVEAMQASVHALLPMPDDVTTTDHETVTDDGAAARLHDFRGLPSAYIEVGELNIFRDESLSYAQHLYAAGISTELHVHPAVPHAPEALVPTSQIAVRMAADRHRVISGI